MTYFTARSNFANKAFIQVKAIMMDFLQHVAWKLVDTVNVMSK